MTTNRPRANRLAARARIMIFGIPAFVVLVLLGIGYFIIHEVTDYFSRQMTRQYAAEAAADFITGTVTHFGTAQSLSRSTAVARWLANENDAEIKAAAIDEIMGIVAYSPHTVPMIAAYGSRNIYDLNAGFTAGDIMPTRQMPGLPYSQWFYDVRDAVPPFSLNIRRRVSEMGEFSLFVIAQHRVYYQGGFVGVITTGTPFELVHGEVFGGYEMAARRGYIIDGDGKVRMDSAGLLERFEFGWHIPEEIPEAAANPNLADAVGAHLQTMVGGVFPAGGGSGEAIPIRGDYRYAAIAPIFGTDWSAVVLLDRADIPILYFLPMIIAAFALIAAAVTAGGIMVKRGILMPLFKLTKSITDDTELFGLERDDEIGDLARTMDSSGQSLLQREELLRATNRAAEILLTTAGEWNSMAAISKAMEIVGESIDADRVILWRNETIDGELYFVLRNSWVRSTGVQSEDLHKGKSFPYSTAPGWIEIFSHGEIINSPISKLPREQADFLGTYDVQSILIVPLFIDGEFFGRLSVGDCRRERVFSDIEVDIIRSAGMMVVNAYNLVEKSAEIKAAVARAEEANNAKSRFLARMSHEIRTPMNAVMGIAGIQLQKGSHPPDTEGAFLRIHHSSNHLLSIINDILDLSQVEAGKTEIIKKEYETSDMVVETVQLNMMHIGKKPIDLKLSIDENLPLFLEGDEVRIKQVINNLMSNAFKYTNEGTVTLDLRRGEPLLGDCGDTLTLVIEVADTGQGMSAEQLATLFDTEFNRLNLHLNREIEGTGLGMTITSHLVNLMGGKISAKSAPGEGSVFTVHIPQKIIGSEVLGSSAARLENIDSVKNSLKKITVMEIEEMHGKVLVVDDVEVNLYVAEGMLGPYKLDVEIASSGYEAVELIKNGNTYDIIFMDHMMPGMDGIEATKHIRGLGYTLPIVALTANSLAGQKEKFLENGFNGFISKPIVPNKLDKCLKKFIAGTGQTAVAATPSGPPSTALIASFLRDADKAAAALAEIIRSDSYDSEDIKHFIINTHSMKSALYNVGENSLAETAASLEEAGRANDVEKIRAETPAFIKNLAETMDKLTPDKPLDTTDEDLGLLRRLLDDICAACENLDKKAAKKALGELGKKSWSNETREILGKISTALLHSDFEIAAEAAREGQDILEKI